MGIIIKNYNNEMGFTSDKYVKIDSIRAGMGEDNKITCTCTEWANSQTRAENKQYIKANVNYHIPDGAVSGDNVIHSVYPLLKSYFQNQGYTVEDDTNTYGEDLKAEQEAKMTAQAQVENDGTE